MILNVELYLKENIDEQFTIKNRQVKNEFPIFLKNSYNFYDMEILNIKCVLLEILEESSNINTIEKHIKRIEEITNLQTILCYKKITRHKRKSLIEKRISFVIEDGQMFFPFIALDLKKGNQYVDKNIKSFSTSAQIAYLFFLYNKNSVINATDFALKMGFTKMTASRALNELYDTKLITYKIGGKTGRSKEYQKINETEYFKKGRTYLKNPVKNVIYVKTAVENTLIAGLDALSELSMINFPEHSVRAISFDRFKKYNKKDIEVIEDKDIAKDQNIIELEIWEYEPKLLTDKKYVDIMSLYATLKEEKDERIEQALEEILRGEEWYMD